MQQTKIKFSFMHAFLLHINEITIVPISPMICNYLTDVGQIPSKQSSFSSSNCLSRVGWRGQQLKQGAQTNNDELKINTSNSFCNTLCYLPEPRASSTKQSVQTVHLPTFEAYIRGKTTPLAMPTKEDMIYKISIAS